MKHNTFEANPSRYTNGMIYNRCGASGILLPQISLGLWKNFGAINDFENSRNMVRYAFNHGIVHFDLANNYGPPYGSAEQTFGRIMDEDLRPYRDELFISTKAGYDMWPGPYGNWGSRKYLISSLDQSLSRMHLDYVDLFYIHRYDPDTPLEETLQALVDIVRSGKSLYVGISRWPLKAFSFAADYLQKRDIHCLTFQGRVNMLDQALLDEGILNEAVSKGIGFVGFSPLAQGLLTDRYLESIPEGSRMSREETLHASSLTPELKCKLIELNKIANQCGLSLAQLALLWVLQQRGVTSVIMGASSVEQISSAVDVCRQSPLSPADLQRINQILNP